ncbi:hypothetical protein TcasGA2_TC012931 [Tribolium castaneum]|uniref:BED-type domain-containing protein n=1 Tax=Tribolium castaneum TaxID=7070 RepID=D7EM12_TRICA|nr:hypothetical protein TcasGA2_TC012931 [Tribolium castaneum]
MASKSKSEVWGYFEKDILTNEATCLYCKKTYQTSGNTSNLWNHIKKVHNIENEKGTLSTADTVSLSSMSAMSSSGDFQESESASHERKQKVLVLDSYFYKTSTQKKKEIDNLVIDMITLDMQPLSIVGDVGFQQLINKLDPHYKLPSKTQVKEVLLPRRYNEVKIKLKQILEGDVATQWNSTYLMIQRILQIGDSLTVAILNIKSDYTPLSLEEKLNLKELIKTLEIFFHAPEIISGDYVTSSLVVPIVTGMYTKLNEVERNLTDSGSEISKKFLAQIRNQLDKRLACFEAKTIPKLACLLDPRFKTLAFKNKDNSLNGQACI